MKDRTPYTYLVGWSKFNIFYYGCRYAKNCHPNDLFSNNDKSYKTSSKHVLSFIKINGEPDIVKIRRTFNTVDECRKWETKVLKKIKAKDRKDFLNETDNISFSSEASARGQNSPNRNKKEMYNKVRSKLKNKPKSESHKQALSEAKKGIVIGEKNNFYGKTHSDEFKKRQSERKKLEYIGSGNPRATPITYNGIYYDTLKEMREDLNLSFYKVKKLQREMRL